MPHHRASSLFPRFRSFLRSRLPYRVHRIGRSRDFRPSFSQSSSVRRPSTVDASGAPFASSSSQAKRASSRLQHRKVTHGRRLVYWLRGRSLSLTLFFLFCPSFLRDKQSLKLSTKIQRCFPLGDIAAIPGRSRDR